jgi:hypothetical protein
VKSASNARNLPAWFVPPSSVVATQMSLFSISLADTLVRLRISPDELNRWHARGWVSFDASTALELDRMSDPRTWELIFVRDIVRSGLSDAQTEALFAQLDKPFAYNPDRIAFSFRYGWVQVASDDDPDPSDVIAEYLGEWIAGCDEATLRSLLAQITETLGSLEHERTENRSRPIRSSRRRSSSKSHCRSKPSISPLPVKNPSATGIHPPCTSGGRGGRWPPAARSCLPCSCQTPATNFVQQISRTRPAKSCRNWLGKSAQMTLRCGGRS